MPNQTVVKLLQELYWGSNPGIDVFVGFVYSFLMHARTHYCDRYASIESYHMIELVELMDMLLVDAP